MSAIPYATYSASRVHDMIRAQMQKEDEKRGTRKDAEEASNKPKLSEMYNYNLKFMKSVWGMYNQYAPQAFQKNEELVKL